MIFFNIIQIHSLYYCSQHWHTPLGNEASGLQIVQITNPILLIRFPLPWLIFWIIACIIIWVLFICYISHSYLAGDVPGRAQITKFYFRLSIQITLCALTSSLIFCTLYKYCLYITYHVHIWQVLPQLSCSNICPIWMWFNGFNRQFCRIKIVLKGEINALNIGLWKPDTRTPAIKVFSITVQFQIHYPIIIIVERIYCFVLLSSSNRKYELLFIV